MSKGYALCVGLNRVDPNFYQGWSGPLNACEADARAMGNLLSRKGFDAQLMLSNAATRDSVISHIQDVAMKAEPGDIFVYTNSSHGGQLPDLNADEADGADETICLYDGELVDDEIFALWALFKRGVRVLMISDSCHSGTVARSADVPQPHQSFMPQRAMPVDVSSLVYLARQHFYEPILSSAALKESKSLIVASVLHLGACADNQTASDGLMNGLFTSKLLSTWAGGAFRGCYSTFLSQIRRRMPPTQTPQMFWASPRDAAFEAQKPFTI
jgi:hypothetical protein